MAYDGAARSDKAVLADFLASAGFSRDAYLIHSPDLRHFDDYGLMEHMLDCGLAEHRRLPLRDPFAAVELLERSRLGETSVGLVARALASEIALAQRADGGLNLSVDQTRSCLRLRVFGIRPLIVTGDSHSEAYVQPVIARSGVLPLWFCRPGASAKGLRKGPGADPWRTLQRMSMIPEDIPVLTMFGQVDLEFCYFYRRLVRQDFGPFDERTFRSEASGAIEAYDGYLSTLPRPAMVAGVFPSTLADADVRDAFANAQIGFLMAYAGHLRRDLDAVDFPTMNKRSELHRWFNSQLKALRPPYLAPASSLMNEAGNLRPELLKGVDHHMCFETAAFRSLEALSAVLA